MDLSYISQARGRKWELRRGQRLSQVGGRKEQDSVQASPHGGKKASGSPGRLCKEMPCSCAWTVFMSVEPQYITMGMGLIEQPVISAAKWVIGSRRRYR